MPDYKAPLRDMRFVLEEVLDCERHYQSLSGGEPVTPDLLEAIINEGARFAEQALSPINRNGDEEGCRLDGDTVTTPTGFRDAYNKYCEAGWPALGAPAEFGGQGLPESVGVVINEMLGSANWAWSMYPGLTGAAVRALLGHGSDEQKARYLPPLVEGRWAGTMCLTESHCGSDLGLLRTKAVPTGDGRYAISGSKIFISSGEHDLTENIVHLVLARVEGAPAGTKGISLFIVPKFLPAEDGAPGERNAVRCGALEHKMGINGSATCVMNFDEAAGFLIGEENHGLSYMFTMMNAARLGTALQGLSLGELSYQGALAYARERLQMRSLSGPQNPDGPADPIIVHPDVRRMLLTQKALTEGNRALCYWLAQLVDTEDHGSGEAQREARDQLALLTPIAKAFATETGVEVASHGIQVFGGHGYVREWGMEQILRDVRISTVYEGTTGIQALDLLGRKIMGSKGELLRSFNERLHAYCEAHKDYEALAEFVTPLAALNREWGGVTQELGAKVQADPEELGAAAVDYLMYAGYIVLAYLWCRMAQTALSAAGDDPFYGAKVKTARFYFQRILPRTAAHKQMMLAGSGSLMAFADEEFAF